MKSYPQDGVLDIVGLNRSLVKAGEQRQQYAQNVLAPAAKLSFSWKKLNIVCYPEVSNRQQLRNIGVDDNSLKFILTAEELEQRL